jgi:hypothetical protein
MTQLEAVRAALRQAMKVCHVPDTLHGGLERYLLDRILPGGFLQACLCNDLAEACRRADPVNVHHLAPIIEFLEGYASPDAWGSRDHVLAWTVTPNRLEILPPRRPNVPPKPNAPLDREV